LGIAGSALVVRPERPEDARAVWTVHEAAFGRPDEARLVARLRQEARPCVSLVAERAGRVVGHVLFSPIAIEGDPSAPAGGGLAPVAVLPDEQGRGAGAALIRTGIDAARGLGWELLVVLGDPAYYSRFGFVLAAPHGLHYGSHDLDVAFQALALAPGVQERARGWVRYHPAFAELAG
jgi:putative acetyltransferase